MLCLQELGMDEGCPGRSVKQAEWNKLQISDCHLIQPFRPLSKKAKELCNYHLVLSITVADVLV